MRTSRAWFLVSQRHLGDGKGLALFLGQFYEWDSWRNAEVATAHGMISELPSVANWWGHENLDNAQTGLHDHLMYRKYGYGRACAQVSVDIRSGRLTREKGMIIVSQCDGLFPEVYAGVPVQDVLDRIGMTRVELNAVMDQFCSPCA